MLKKTQWTEFVGLKENAELALILDVVYRLCCSLDYFVALLQGLQQVLKDPLHTALLLTVATFLIMQYEVAVPFVMVTVALKIVHSLYAHKQFKQQPPNVSANIEFIKLISTKVGDVKEAIDFVLHEIVFWNDPQLST